MANLDLLTRGQYLSIETFRKNGVGVKTPVWFVEFNGELCFTTEPNSGKVKRMRNNPAVRVAPCKMDGTVTGDWQPATIRMLDAEDAKKVDKIYSKKYGLMKVLFELPKIFSKKPERVFFAIKLD